MDKGGEWDNGYRKRVSPIWDTQAYDVFIRELWVFMSRCVDIGIRCVGIDISVRISSFLPIHFNGTLVLFSLLSSFLILTISKLTFPCKLQHCIYVFLVKLWSYVGVVFIWWCMHGLFEYLWSLCGTWCTCSVCFPVHHLPNQHKAPRHMARVLSQSPSGSQ